MTTSTRRQHIASERRCALIWYPLVAAAYGLLAYLYAFTDWR